MGVCPGRLKGPFKARGSIDILYIIEVFQLPEEVKTDGTGILF